MPSNSIVKSKYAKMDKNGVTIDVLWIHCNPIDSENEL